MVSVAVLLCSPAGATYHGILLLFPLGLQCRILIDRKMTNGILLVLFNLLLIGLPSTFAGKINCCSVQFILYLHPLMALHVIIYIDALAIV